MQLNFGYENKSKKVYKPNKNKTVVPLDKRNIESDQLNVQSHDFAINLNADENFYIDLFSLRILSLLVCRGEVKEKAEFLLDLVQMRNLNNEPEVDDGFATKK